MVDFPAGQSGEPDHGGLLPLEVGAGGLVDLDGLPVDVVGTAQREVQQPGGDRGVGEAVDEDEPAHVAVLGVGVERDRAVEAEVADADLVELEGLGAVCSSVLTLILYLGWATVAVTVRVPIFIR